MIVRLVAFFACAVMLTSSALVAEPAAGTPSDNAAFDSTAAAEAPVVNPAGADLPSNTKAALKLAGLVTFVANSCPALKPDYDRFKAALGALGVGIDDLSKPDLKAIYLGYTARYATDSRASCERARLAFGAKGSTIPDLFAAR